MYLCLKKKIVLNIRFNVDVIYFILFVFYAFLASTVGKRFPLVFIYTVSAKLTHF